MLKPFPGRGLSSVLSFWGERARDQLAIVLKEYDDYFMKHKADIGKCKIAKHREGARRMSPDRAAKVNQEFRNLLASGLIQPSVLTLGQWDSHGKVKVRRTSLLL